MQIFSAKDFIGSADEELEKVVNELCEFLLLLKSLSDHVENEQAKAKILNFVECVIQASFLTISISFH